MLIISKILFRFILLLWIILIYPGCVAQVNLSTRNLNPMYEQQHIRTAVQYTGDSTVTIHYSINRKALFSQFNGMDQVPMKICFRMFPGYDTAIPIDSICDSLQVYSNGKHNLTGNIAYKVKKDKILVVEGRFKAGGNFPEIVYFSIDKPGNRGRQNYLLLDSAGSEPVFRNYIFPREKVNLVRRDNPPKQIIKVYNRDFPIALPPFSFNQPPPFDLKPDSMFTVVPEGNNRFRFSSGRKGFYHFQSDTFTKEGFTIYDLGEDFPEISTLSGMIYPLRYITSKQEYEDLLKAENQKTALDEFWLEAGGNPAKAKELIRIYYTRVEMANKLFTSYLEGWKTDRGMIYLIYGKPDVVNRSAYYESWTYGEGNNISSIVFNFSRIANPFSDNDYELNRSVNYKNMWFEAVGQWRKGRPFNFNEN